MNIKTVWVLRYDGGEVESGNKIRIIFKTGDVLIGEYNNSDDTALSLLWKDMNIEIEFKDIAHIKKVN